MLMSQAERLLKIAEHLSAVIELVGLDKSESATETFVEYLDMAVINAREEVKQSHKQGLCLDCRWSIAETLLTVKVLKKGKRN